MAQRGIFDDRDAAAHGALARQPGRRQPLKRCCGAPLGSRRQPLMCRASGSRGGRRRQAVCWVLAVLFSWEVCSQAPELPEGQLCPTVCTDLSAGCPTPEQPAGDAPELYVGDPFGVQWPDGTAHALCQLADNINDCCACGGGSVPDACPAGQELQLTLPRETPQAGPEDLADQIGTLAWRATSPNLLRRDLSGRVRDRVRILSIDLSPDESSWVITFYFAAWYAWFPSSTELEAALGQGVETQLNALIQLRPPGANRVLPPLLRLAPPDVLRPYPNSIAFAEYQAGVGREEPACNAGVPETADNCPRYYRHRQYPPEPRDLTRNTTGTAAGLSLLAFGIYQASRPLVPGGRFVLPMCAASHNLTWANESCPVEDTTYCDEFHSLDLDCDGVLSLSEAAETTTWYDEPSYHGLTPLSLYPNNIGALGETSANHRWSLLLEALDGNDDGHLSIFDWLKGSRVYKPTYRHCGEVLEDKFFRYISQADRSLGGTNGAFPIQPCATCEIRWIYCELDVEGGGWNLVYESVGKTDFLMSTEEVNVQYLWDPSFGDKTADRYSPYRTQDLGGGILRGGRRDPQGAKLDDESIKHLCDGQYMIHRPGQHPTFCRFLNVSQYGDNAESVKACSFEHDADYSGYLTLGPDEGSSFGFSTGVSASGVGTFGFVAQLGYLWQSGGYYTLANIADGGSAVGSDPDYGASSHWVSPDDPNIEFSHWKPQDREVLTCHTRDGGADCKSTQTDPLRGSQGPRMYVEEQCLCAREYTAETTTGELQRFGYPASEAAWLNSDETMTDQDISSAIFGPPRFAGCQNPDDDPRGAWCFTENLNCGYGKKYQYCEEECESGTGIGGAPRQGCPVQIYCRTRDTVPRSKVTWSPYNLGGLPEFCGSVDAIEYEGEFGETHELVPEYDVGEDFWHAYLYPGFPGCGSVLIGLLVVCCLVCCGWCMLKRWNKRNERRRAIPGYAIARKTYNPTGRKDMRGRELVPLPGRSGDLKAGIGPQPISLRKGDKLRIYDVSALDTSTWHVQKLSSSEHGFVPRQFCRLIPTEEHEEFLQDAEGKFDVEPKPVEMREDILAVAAKVKRYVAQLEGGNHDEETEEEDDEADAEIMALRKDYQKIMEIANSGVPLPRGMVNTILSRELRPKLRRFPETPRQHPIGAERARAQMSGTSGDVEKPATLQLESSTLDAFDSSRPRLERLAPPATRWPQPEQPEPVPGRDSKHFGSTMAPLTGLRPQLAQATSMAAASTDRSGVFMPSRWEQPRPQPQAGAAVLVPQGNQPGSGTNPQLRATALQLRMQQQGRERQHRVRQPMSANLTGAALPRSLPTGPQTPRQTRAPGAPLLSQQQRQRQRQAPATPTTVWPGLTTHKIGKSGHGEITL